jgi:hypothetical protein
MDAFDNCRGKQARRPSTSNNAAIVLSTLAFAVVAYRYCRLVAGRSPPVRRLLVQLRCRP